MQLVSGHTTAVKEALSPGKEFWESSKTLKTLLEENYFKEDGEDFQWPDVLKAMVSDGGCMSRDSCAFCVDHFALRPQKRGGLLGMGGKGAKE